MHGTFLQPTLNVDVFTPKSQPAAMQWWCQGTWECQQCHASPKLLGAHLLSLYRLIYNCRAASATFVFASLWKWSLLCWKSFYSKTFLVVFATQSYTEPFQAISILTIDGIYGIHFFVFRKKSLVVHSSKSNASFRFTNNKKVSHILMWKLFRLFGFDWV